MRRAHLLYSERLKLRRGEFKEQDKAIYLWVYDEPTGVVTEHKPINKYEIHMLTNADGIVYYKDEDDVFHVIKTTRLSKFDRCINDKVYSFNPDKDNAVNIIKSTLKAKLDKYETEYKRFAKAFNKFLYSN